VLGPLRVTAEGLDHRPGSPTRRAILTALLLQAGRAIGAEEFQELLWDEPPPSAAANIRSYIAGVRADLAGWATGLQQRLHTLHGGGGYRMWLQPEELDLQAFTRLAGQGRAEFLAGRLDGAVAALTAARQLWQGPFGGGLPGTRWFMSQAAALNNARIDSLQDLYAAQILTGADPLMIAYDIERTIAEAPYRERLWLLLAGTQYLNNDVANSLQAVRRCRTLLADDLGIHLPPEILALQSAILGWDSDQVRRLIATGGSPWQAAGARR
jgi:DNA-binding SARP family transcriptional activator